MILFWPSIPWLKWGEINLIVIHQRHFDCYYEIIPFHSMQQLAERKRVDFPLLLRLDNTFAQGTIRPFRPGESSLPNLFLIHSFIEKCFKSESLCLPNCCQISLWSVCLSAVLLVAIADLIITAQKEFMFGEVPLCLWNVFPLDLIIIWTMAGLKARLVRKEADTVSLAFYLLPSTWD